MTAFSQRSFSVAARPVEPLADDVRLPGVGVRAVGFVGLRLAERAGARASATDYDAADKTGFRSCRQPSPKAFLCPINIA